MSVDPVVAKVLVSRYGMDGRGSRSLEEVAREIGWRRSELRRLEGQVLRALRTLAARASRPTPGRG